MSRRSVLWTAVAAGAVVASVVVIGIVWPGLDAKTTPPADTAVWALQTGEGRRYARVNTAIDELDTVRSIANPSAVAQTDDGAYLFSESFGKLTRIDESLPADLDDQTLRQSPSTPAGTVEAAVSGDYVAYRTDSGAVFTGTLSGGRPVQLDPSGDGPQAPEFTAEAIAVDDAGVVYAYSKTDRVVLRYRIPGSEVLGQDAVRSPPTSTAVRLTAAGGVWFLVDADGGRGWRRGGDAPRKIDLVGDVAYGRPTSGGDAAWVADQTGLVRLPVDGSAPSRAVGGGSVDRGEPARPLVRDGIVYAAWLGASGGTLWRSDTGDRDLPYGGKSLADDRRPVFVSAGSSVILNETRSGWVWNANTAKLMTSSQDWSLDDRADPQSQPSDEQAQVVIDPKPPVAEPDAFGVRAGSLVALPVLLNDHDPNEDVLSIDPGSVTGLDPAFGTVSITDNGQRLAVQTAPGATGTATFRYRVTDGTTADGLYSPPTTVTLTVSPAPDNAAPQWCGVTGCLAVWPTPQVAPGGTVTVPVLDGWVDPDGDPLMLLSVTDDAGVGAVASTPSGEVVFQHSNASSTQSQVVKLEVTVADTRGATTTRPLIVRVTPKPTLTAESFTVVDTQSGGLTVDVGPHLTGTEGRMSLTSVRVLDDANAEAVPTAGSTSFDFSARGPGTYRVSYTVTDGRSEASATARITILPADAPAQLATSPVVAFVHPKQDVTLDVFAAVTNPTRRVLLLSDVQPSPAAGASMSVDAVGQNYLRVSGTTADGAPGLLGTIRYVVSDGTSDAGARITGEATVYLLPPASDLAPIAVEDSVVVRAGAQVDIPVLDNDVATAGGAIILDPSSVTSSTKDALAFASGRVLRYLAPEKPGAYRVQYSVYAAGSPTLADSATVRVTVISAESNRAPRPETLEGRVLSGQSTTIPFHSFGVDPDGDDVTLDRILTQPKSGSATLSADGESIVYSSVPGFHGQVSFTYDVTDPSGATGTATVRVGVLDEQANPSPVTFTDYVQLQAGSDSAVKVLPLANDIDPTGGTLTLTGVHPDVVQTLADGSANPEYARLEGLIADSTKSQVVIRAGNDPETMSFLYDVESSTGNTARGLIVVKVVREAVPDYPVVTDTILTAETRDRFPDGIDVVAGKVAWSGGDVSRLTLTLWGDQPGVTVEGTRLSGSIPTLSRVIPFALTGVGANGEKVTSYGFLRVPGVDDLTLALRSGVKPQQVTEREAVTWDMASLVSIPRGATLEVGSAVTSTKARKGGVCERASGTKVRYDAGEGAPWTDACIVPVRLSGTKNWTYLSVPVAVTALTPVPVLRAASITAAPGQTVTYDLKTLTTWQGRSDWDRIVYSLAYSGADFRIERDGALLKITGADAATPGSEEVAVVGVTSHPGVAPARLILRVGAAPSTLPQGGTVARRCSEADGSSCVITVTGATGEVNPLPRTPLRVVGVTATGTCVGVTFAVASSTGVRASWTADAPGATCTASFSLRDAQGRETSADRDGRLLLDLQGYPKAPAALVQSAYGDQSVTLRVDPGDARSAYPLLTGFVVRSQGRTVVTCAADGTCPSFSAPNGEERVYSAVAVNAVGESRSAATTSAWAYDAPPAPKTVTAAPVVTSGDGGIVSVTIGGLDTTETAGVRLTSDNGDTLDVGVGRGDGTVFVPNYRIGSNALTRLTVTPYSRFALPPGFDGSNTGQTVTIATNGIGAPVAPALSLSSNPNDDRTATITAQGAARSGGDGSRIRYGIVADGTPCTVSTDGGSATFTVPVGQTYRYRLCAESWYDGQSFGRVETTADVTAFPTTRAPRGYTFTVAPTPIVGTGRAEWRISDAPVSTTETPPAGTDVRFGGYPTDVFDRDPGITAWYQWGSWKSDVATVTPRAGSAPYQVQATWGVDVCEGGQPLQVSGASTVGPSVVSFDTSGARYLDDQGQVLAPTGDGTVPIGAVTVENLRVTVDWSASATSQGWNLQRATASLSSTCTPNNPPPAPDPNP